MKKIILIENRPERMKQSMLGIQDESLNNYSFLKIKTGADYDAIKHKITNENLETTLADYDVIICHRSAFEETNRIKLKNFCKKYKAALVFFSGSITESFLLNDGYPLLSLNSKLLYSHNLILFLNEYAKGTIEPAILQFGNEWQISYLLTLRDKLNQLLLYKTKSDRAYIELQNNLKDSLKSAPSTLNLKAPEGELSETKIMEVKEIISDKINKIFAFEL